MSDIRLVKKEKDKDKDKLKNITGFGVNTSGVKRLEEDANESSNILNNYFTKINNGEYLSSDDLDSYKSGTQFRNNRGGYVQVALSIPIFNGLSARSSKRRAKNAYDMARLEQFAVARAVESEVSQTWQEMQGYGKQYVQGEKKVSAAQLAYDGAERKFENGLISALDLQTAANTLLQAKSDRLHARLQYIIKTRMVDYYNGKPLVR